MSEAILYRHFASKRELFDHAVVGRLRDDLRRQVEATKAVATSELPNNERFGRIQESWLEGFISMVPYLGVALFSDRADGEKVYRDVVTPFLDEIATIGSDDFGLGVGEPVDTLVRALFGINILIALEESYADDASPIEVLAGQVTDLLYFGLDAERSLRD